MNAHDSNTLFRTVQRLACSNHRRDDAGWPLGNCTECADYRAKMDAWYMAKVMEGIHQPEYDDGLDHDQMHDEVRERAVGGT